MSWCPQLSLTWLPRASHPPLCLHALLPHPHRHDSTTVKLFWRVVAELTPAQQAALLRFVTSCSRPPLGGFRYLQPPLTLHKVCVGKRGSARGGFGLTVFMSCVWPVAHKAHW